MHHDRTDGSRGSTLGGRPRLRVVHDAADYNTPVAAHAAEAVEFISMRVQLRSSSVGERAWALIADAAAAALEMHIPAEDRNDLNRVHRAASAAAGRTVNAV